MKKLLAALLLIPSLAFAVDYMTFSQVFTNTYPDDDHKDFQWSFNGYSDTKLNVSFLYSYSTVNFRLSWPKDGTVYLDVTDGVASTTNYTATILTTNFPPDGQYYAEFAGVEGGIKRVFAAGRVMVQHSIYQNTDQSSWTNPAAGTTIGPTLHTISTPYSAWPFASSVTVNETNGASSGSLSAGVLTINVRTNAAAAGDITGVTAGTWITGGATSGDAPVAVDTNAVMAAVAGKGYITSYTETDPIWAAVSNSVLYSESDTAALAALGVHSNLALAVSGHGPELDPVWAAVSNTVTTGAAAGATALQAEADTLDAVTGRGQTTTRAMGFTSDTTADSMIYHTQTDEILGAVAGPANLLSGGAYWLLYGASHALGPRLALNGNGGPIEIMSQTTMIEGNGVAYTNAGPIYSSDYYLDGTNITALWGGGSDGGATNITAGSSDSYNFSTRTVTWNTNAAAGGGGASALADLSDVAPLTGATANQVLAYNGTIWTNTTEGYNKHVYIGTVPDGTVAGVGDTILTHTENHDPAGGHSDATNPTRYTVQRSGTYLVAVVLGSSANGFDDNEYVALKLNGSNQATQFCRLVDNENVIYTGMPVTFLLQATSGQYIEVFLSLGGSVTLSSLFTHIYITRVGE